MRLLSAFSVLMLVACGPSAVGTGTYLSRGDAAFSRGDGAAAVGNYEAAKKAGAPPEELSVRTKDAAALWLEHELKRAEARSPARGADLLATVAAVEALAARYEVTARLHDALAETRRRGGEQLWTEQKTQLVPCSDVDPFTCQGQLLALLAAVPAEAAQARREIEAERTSRNRVYAPRFSKRLTESEAHAGARVVALRMLAALGEPRGAPPLQEAKLPAQVDWAQATTGCAELAGVAHVGSGSGQRHAEIRIEGTCDHFDRRSSRVETEHWTEEEQRQSTTTQNFCHQVSEYKSQCTCTQHADINGSGYGTCISYSGCNVSHTVCEPQSTTQTYSVSIPHDGSYTVSSRSVGASLRAVAVARFEGRSFDASFTDGTSKDESSYQSHEHGSSSFSGTSDDGLLAGYRQVFAERVAGIVQQVERAAAASALAEASGKAPLDAEDLVVAASMVGGAAAASDSIVGPIAARYGVSVAMYQRFLGSEAPSFAPSFGGSADLSVPREDADLIVQSQKHDVAVAEHHEDDVFIEKMHGLHGSALLAGMLSAGPDDENTFGGAVGMGVRTSFGTRIFVPIDGSVRIGYGGAKAWNTQNTLLSGLGFRNTRVSGALLGAVGASGFGKEETGRYYLPFGLDLGYGVETSLRIAGGHFVELQGLRLHRPKNERGAGVLPVEQVYRATVRYTYRSAESSSRGEYGALVECNLAYENAKIVPDGGSRGRNCTAGFVLGF